jgi:predicted RNA polymerase sigma factor
VTDTAWIDAALTSARPQAVGALLRYFRNLDTAEEAFQNACARAEKLAAERAAARSGGVADHGRAQCRDR